MTIRFRGTRTRTSLRGLRLIALLIVAALLSACGGCDPLDPANYVDVKQFYPDVPESPETDMGALDTGDGEPDSGRNPKDTGFTFDFGMPPDTGEQPFALTAVVPNFGPVEGGNQVRVEGTGLDDRSVVFVGGKEMDVEVSGNAFVGRIPPGSGPGPVEVKVIAPGGEIRALVDAYTYIEDLRVDSVTPSLVPTTGGVEVEIRGAGFEEPMGVSFSGDAALRVVVVDGELLRVLTPPRPRGFADVRLTTSAESVEAEDAVQYFDPLEIATIDPAGGLLAGGETVTLTGTGFTSNTMVRFGSRSAAVTAVSAQNGTMTVTAPPGAAVGSVDVFVENDIDSAVAEDAYYYRADATPALGAVRPSFGPTDGGNMVRVTGYGFDAANAAVQFGGQSATIQQATATFADVVVPPGVQGAVDVSLLDGAVERDRLTGAYTYVLSLSADAVSPAMGPDSGGTTVTVTGSGFSGAETVLVGGVPAEFTVISDGELEVVTPSHTAGVVDVVVVRDGLEATIADGYTYTATLEVWGFSPVRGAIAGNTYVEVRGRGFFGTLGVQLDGADGSQIRRVDRNNLRFYTPAHAPGEAVLEVTAGGMQAAAPYTFLYFDPASRFGGASGGPVRGSVNITVFANGGGPIENAFVMLSTRAETPYQGWTDLNGQVTLSGADVQGAQTTTATAAGYSSATMQTADSENITLFLNRLDPSSGSGQLEPPPFGLISGSIRATGKLSDPDDSSTYDMAVVGTTTKSLLGSNPPAGSGAVVFGEGRYDIVTRVGDMAVVGLCGTYDADNDTFTPQLLAVERFVFIADKDELEIDLLCDIPLDRTHTYKLVNAPYAPTGPNNNIVEVYWDFGFEGFFASPTRGRGFGALVEVERQPPLEGVIEDISFTAVGGAYTGFGAPYSEATLRNIFDVDVPVVMPTLLDVPEPVSPLPGGVVVDDMIRFQVSGPYKPDFYFVTLRNDMGIPVWQFIVPGDESNVRLPDFPDFSSIPADERPSPLIGGQLFMTVIGARISGGHVYEEFNYRDVDRDLWESYAITSWVLRLR